jgi:hypothetical protein
MCGQLRLVPVSKAEANERVIKTNTNDQMNARMHTDLDAEPHNISDDYPSMRLNDTCDRFNCFPF